MPDNERVAVLIDCDNMSHKWAKQILDETARHGTLGIKRGYGDWTDSHLGRWRDALPRFAIQPVQQFAYTTGKNSTDFALVIDAMDLLYAGTVDTFCIVSSDSDFTRLAMRLRESGKQVIGIGEKKTPKPFQNACDQFTYVEVLVEEAEEQEPDPPETSSTPVKTAAKTAAKAAAPSTKRQRQQELAALLLPAVEATAKEDGWSNLSTVGQYLVNTDPTFDSRNHGYSKLSQLVADVPQLEVGEVSSGGGLTTLRVRAKVTPRKRR